MSFGHLFLNMCGQQMTKSGQLRLNLVQEQPKKNHDRWLELLAFVKLNSVLS